MKRLSILLGLVLAQAACAGWRGGRPSPSGLTFSGGKVASIELTDDATILDPSGNGIQVVEANGRWNFVAANVENASAHLDFDGSFVRANTIRGDSGFTGSSGGSGAAIFTEGLRVSDGKVLAGSDGTWGLYFENSSQRLRRYTGSAVAGSGYLDMDTQTLTWPIIGATNIRDLALSAAANLQYGYRGGGHDRLTSADSPFTVTTETYLETDTSSGAITIVLPDPSGITGRVVKVASYDTTNNVVLDPANNADVCLWGSCADPDTITSGSDFLIELVSDGTNWIRFQ